MNPPFQITGQILGEIAKIERLIGRLESLEHPKPQPYQRAENNFGDNQFSLKDYLNLFKTISTATASRDLATGVESGKLSRMGEKALTVYWVPQTPDGSIIFAWVKRCFSDVNPFIDKRSQAYIPSLLHFLQK